MLDVHRTAITERIDAALAPFVAGSGVVPVVTLERPKVASHGDVACNVALQIAKGLRRNPREIAQAIVDALLSADDGLVARAEIAGPGFVNLFLSPKAHQAVVAAILDEGERFGAKPPATGDDAKVMIEFVSANPTGPLHVGHGRQGALGDVMASLFDDAGPRGHARVLLQRRRRADRDARHVGAGARAGLAPGDDGWPESAYNGDYIAEIAADLLARTAGRRPTTPTDMPRSRVRRRRRLRRDPSLRGRLPAPRAGPRPEGVRRRVRSLLPRVVAVRGRPRRRRR